MVARRTFSPGWAPLLDLAAGVLSLGAAYAFLRHQRGAWETLLQRLTGYPFSIQPVEHLQGEFWLFALLLSCWMLGRVFDGAYRRPSSDRARFPWASLLRGAAIGASLAAVALFLLQAGRINRSLVALYWIFCVGWSFVWEGWGRLLGRARPRPVALGIGSLPAWASTTAEAGWRLGGVLGEAGPQGRGQIGELRAHLAEESYDLIVLAAGVSRDTAQAVFAAAGELGLDVVVAPGEWPNPEERTATAEERGGRPVLVFRAAPRQATARALKRALDLFLSAALLLLLSPLLLFLGLAIRATSPGPALFVQVRAGHRGRPFRMLKFRSMTSQATAERPALSPGNVLSGPAFKLPADPRVTALGRWLRRFSLDELPQLWNVVRGEMSLVGPRPLPLEETTAISALSQRRRLSVPPGITGLWQVSGRAQIRDFAEWVRLDLRYIDRWSLWLDARILAKTPWVVLSGRGAH